MGTKRIARSGRDAEDVGWYPSDPKFRENFNDALAAAIQKVGEHGDTSHLRKVIERAENDDAQKGILRKVVQAVPLDYNRETGGLRLRKIDVPFNWSEAPRINVFSSAILFHQDTIKIGNLEFSASEFIDEVIDALILARKRIPTDDLLRLSETISTIANRKQKRSDRR